MSFRATAWLAIECDLKVCWLNRALFRTTNQPISKATSSARWNAEPLVHRGLHEETSASATNDL